MKVGSKITEFVQKKIDEAEVEGLRLVINMSCLAE